MSNLDTFLLFRDLYKKYSYTCHKKLSDVYGVCYMKHFEISLYHNEMWLQWFYWKNLNPKSEDTYRSSKTFTMNLYVFSKKLIYIMNHHLKPIINIKDRVTKYWDLLTLWIVVCLNTFVISLKHVCTYIKYNS